MKKGWTCKLEYRVVSMLISRSQLLRWYCFPFGRHSCGIVWSKQHLLCYRWRFFPLKHTNSFYGVIFQLILLMFCWDITTAKIKFDRKTQLRSLLSGWSGSKSPAQHRLCRSFSCSTEQAQCRQTKNLHKETTRISCSAISLSPSFPRFRPFYCRKKEENGGMETNS